MRRSSTSLLIDRGDIFGRGIFRREILPDPAGAVSFGILILILALHLMISPDPRGGLFGYLLEFFPTDFRGILFDACFEGFVQAFLLVGPIACVYAGLRHLFFHGDSILPILTIAGGGFLTFLTGLGLILSI